MTAAAETVYAEKPADYFTGCRSEMLEFVPETMRRVLDVGCGAGGFGAAVKQRQPVEVWGIEMTEHAAKLAAKQLDEVLHGTFEESRARLPDSYFDCIIFNDVLEHIPDPWAVVRECRELLAPHGSIVASIPNIRNYEVVYALLFHGRWDYQDCGILDRTHLRFFTRAGMVEMFEGAGFQIERCEGIGRTPFTLLWRIWNNLNGKRFADMEFRQFALRARLSGAHAIA